MTELQQMRGYEEACNAVGLFAGGDSSKATVAMILATEKLYIEELIEANAERVAAIQQNIRQLRALREVIQGNGGTPKI